MLMEHRRALLSAYSKENQTMADTTNEETAAPVVVKKRTRFSDQVTFRIKPSTRRKLEAIRKQNDFDTLAQAARFALEKMA